MLINAVYHFQADPILVLFTEAGETGVQHSGGVVKGGHEYPTVLKGVQLCLRVRVNNDFVKKFALLVEN